MIRNLRRRRNLSTSKIVPIYISSPISDIYRILMENTKSSMKIQSQTSTLGSERSRKLKETFLLLLKNMIWRHCVAEDFRMDAGIAFIFKSTFQQVPYLLNQNQCVGGLAILYQEDRPIFYLVTKKQSSGKPTLYTLWLYLRKLKTHCVAHNITSLAIPRI